MASPVNPNPTGGAAYDVPNLFRPSAPPTPPASSNPNPQIVVPNLFRPSAPPVSPLTSSSSSQNILSNDNSLNLISATFPPPSASYPPPTAVGGGPYSYIPPTSPFHQHPQLYQHPIYSPPSNTREFTNIQPQKSTSYPTPTLQPPGPSTSALHHNIQTPPNPQNHSNQGARILALLSSPPATQEIPHESAVLMPQIYPTSTSSSDFPLPPNVNDFPPGSGLPIPHEGPAIRMPSSKLPKGRHLSGDHLLYDIDNRLPGEMQPQLEVTPITKYGSDPGLVLGRQIAVNKNYICYGLKLGAIRVLNINTALRSLLKGLAQRVTDMVFFAEDVHLLASASMDGRVYVWKITEGPDEEDRQQISGKILIAIQINGDWESVHPRVCWHCHKQEILVVGIGKHILKIDTTKVGKGEKFSAEEPLKCSIEKLINGVQLVGSHDGEVTDLSMCQWMTSRLASASVDGTIKIWRDRKSLPLAVLQPHGGRPVNSVTFLAAPNRPDHVILITGGPLNREVKLWASASEEGWLLPVDAESWQCTQTLELKSSEALTEEVFFNQVVALSQVGLILLANAKKNAIYAVHLEYGSNPAETRMDYIAEFTVTMRILSFTGTSETLHQGEQTVQVYCVQTQAIQQYALDLSQCLPLRKGSLVYEKSDLSVLHDSSGLDAFSDLELSGIKPTAVSVSSSVPKASTHESGSEDTQFARYPVGPSSAESSTLQELASSSMESKPIHLAAVSKDGNLFSGTSPALPLSPRLSRTLSGFRNISSSFEHAAEPKIADRQIDSVPINLSDTASLGDDSESCDNKRSQDEISIALNHPINFRHPTHLVTPSEILMANSSTDALHTTETKGDVEPNIHDVLMKSDTKDAVVEVKVVGETSFNQNIDTGSPEKLQTSVLEDKEKSFCSQSSDLGIEMQREFHALLPESYIMDEDRLVDGTTGTETVIHPSLDEERVHDSANDGPMKIMDSSTSAQQSAQLEKGKEHKGKSVQKSVPSSPSASPFNSMDSSNEPGISCSTPVESQIFSMQETMNQILALQKEMQKQMATTVAIPFGKECKRLETALSRSIEKIVKANADAFLAHFLEENAKREKASRERALQVTTTISNFINKDLSVMIEKTVKRELSAVGQSVARSITPTVEKAISSSIAESFQKGVGDKAVIQLEKSVSSKLEATVSRQIQNQFQTFGKQALQETLKSTLEASVIPAFDMSCRVMFEQIDGTFQKGITEHTTAAVQKQLEAHHSSLALSLRDAVNSASSISQALSTELLDGQRKLVALAIAGANSKATSPLIDQLNNGSLGVLHEKLEVDPTKELSRLISDHKYEEAFTSALQRSDVTIVSWLCSQVDLPTILATSPLPLSQGVLLSLLQQLACDIGKDTPRKLTWMREVLTAINPTDSVIAVHVRPIFEQVYQIMNHQRSIPTTAGSELSNIRLIMHVINSMLMSFK